MAVAFDVGAKAETADGDGSTIDVSFTPGSGSNMVIIVQGLGATANKTVASVQYDPGGGDQADFTFIDDVTQSSTDLHTTGFFILKDVDIVKSTAKTIRGTINSGTCWLGIGVASFTGVDQETSHENYAESSTSQAPPEDDMNITSVSGDLIVGAFCRAGASTGTWGTGWFADEITNGVHWGADYGDGLGTDNVIWTYSGNIKTAKNGLNLIEVSPYEQVSFRFRNDDGGLVAPA